MAPAAVRFRPATDDDVEGAARVWYATERVAEPDVPPLRLDGDEFRHDLDHGDFFVAERGGK